MANAAGPILQGSCRGKCIPHEAPRPQRRCAIAHGEDVYRAHDFASARRHEAHGAKTVYTARTVSPLPAEKWPGSPGLSPAFPRGGRGEHAMVVARALLLSGLVAVASAHSSLIYPKPRNAIDSSLPEWSDGKAPYRWPGGAGVDDYPCACVNGTHACESTQTCLWMSVGCSLGCLHPAISPRTRSLI